MVLGVSKKRSPYDKIIKQVLEQFRQELQPVRDVGARQETIMAQNEKIIAFLRQIWGKCEECESSSRTENPS